MIKQFAKMYAKLTLLLLVSTAWAVPRSELIEEEMHPHFARTRVSPKISSEELTSSYWNQNARRTLAEKTGASLNQNVAKNVIMFLGDGMSIPTVAAARVYIGGEEAELSFDKFPYTGLSKTYAVDRQVADSANTATAYLCGVKANYGTMGLGPEVARRDCVGQTNVTNHAFSIAYYSQLKGKRTGLVTTSRVTHASPGGVYAHIADRNWESDSDVISYNQDPSICADIANQLVYGETGENLDVIMGGGRAKFLPNNVQDEEGNSGVRSDGVNLIEEWVARTNGTYVWNRNQLLALDDSVDRVLGLFGHDHLDYNMDRDTTMDPSLAEMTQSAIEVLSRGDNGYFLFVEGARIDMAHHATEARIALDETAEFSKAIQTAVDLTDERDTLIVVTSDHSHTLAYSGYPTRGNDIFAVAGTGSDGVVYTTLSYANGPGYKANNDDGSRYDVTTDDMSADHYRFPAYAPLSSETHGGDDVAIFARGPWAHLFSGVLEQNVIPHLMSYASCVGENDIDPCNLQNSGVFVSIPSLLFLIVLSSFVLKVQLFIN